MFFCSILNKLKDTSAFATYSNDLFSHVFMYQGYAYVVVYRDQTEPESVSYF